MQQPFFIVATNATIHADSGKQNKAREKNPQSVEDAKKPVVAPHLIRNISQDRNPETI